jgi:hypothetical protein
MGQELALCKRIQEDSHVVSTAPAPAATDENGSYLSGSIGRLKEIEPTLNDESQNVPSVVTHTANEYEVTSENKNTKNVFKIKRNEKGEVSRTCTTEKVGGCPEKGIW